MIVASEDDGGPSQLLDLTGRQYLKDLEDRTIDIGNVLDSTGDLIVSIIDKYRQFRRDSEGESHNQENGEFDSIESALREKHRDVMSYHKTIITLHTKLKSTIETVGED